jgi:hypothetical protein
MRKTQVGAKPHAVDVQVWARVELVRQHVARPQRASGHLQKPYIGDLVIWKIAADSSSG